VSVCSGKPGLPASGGQPCEWREVLVARHSYRRLIPHGPRRSRPRVAVGFIIRRRSRPRYGSCTHMLRLEDDRGSGPRDSRFGLLLDQSLVNLILPACWGLRYPAERGRFVQVQENGCEELFNSNLPRRRLCLEIIVVPAHGWGGAARLPYSADASKNVHAEFQPSKEYSSLKRAARRGQSGWQTQAGSLCPVSVAALCFWIALWLSASLPSSNMGFSTMG